MIDEKLQWPQLTRVPSMCERCVMPPSILSVDALIAAPSIPAPRAKWDSSYRGVT